MWDFPRPDPPGWEGGEMLLRLPAVGEETMLATTAGWKQAKDVQPGDVLLATTACMGRDGTFERKVIPSRYLDFDTIMNAIGSNEPKFNKQRKNDVILQFARPGSRYDDDGDPYDGGKRGITAYLDSLKFPSDSPWLAR